MRRSSLLLSKLLTNFIDGSPTRRATRSSDDLDKGYCLHMLTPEIAKTLDTTTCDREPIHIPGSIQPHGFLLALDADSLQIRHASENVREYLGAPASQIVGKPLKELFGDDRVSQLVHKTDEPTLDQRAVSPDQVELKSDGKPARFDVIAHRRDGLLILE